jgi:predicted O-linked N-acetylglucosamine transferase (SPINDLY family)
VVVSYINHLATSGVPTVDYILADDISASPDLDKYYTEKIFRMRGCFFCFNYEDAQMPPVADEVPAVRNGYITFGCFGSGSKINNQLIEIWAAVLLQVHGSKLFLRNRQLDNFDNRRFMEKRFERFGVTPDRLIIRPGTDRRGILRSYADVDISLDTYPYCGGNTIAESLWQGVPVISLMGERFLSRYGASILHHCGCSDLVAHSAKQYADIAEALAKDLGKLGSYRRNLRQMCLDYGFADVKTFTRNLEDAYTEMFENAMG